MGDVWEPGGTGPAIFKKRTAWRQGVVKPEKGWK